MNPREKKMLREAFLLVKLFLREPQASRKKRLGASPSTSAVAAADTLTEEALPPFGTELQSPTNL